jgi:hypothetical protein
MLSERLREVVTRLEQLPANEQDRMAELIAAELDEKTRWQRALSDSHELVLDKLLAEAKEQALRGEARDLDELL